MKPLFVISCPIDTYSGYGARSRDLVKSIIESDKYDVKILPQRWGSTPWGFIKNNPSWGFLQPHLLKNNQVDKRPDIWMQITIPNEFQPLGVFSIGVTAGVETTTCPPEWIEGMNRMDINIVPSTHSRDVFQNIKFEKVDKNTNQSLGTTQLEKPIEVVFEGINLDVYKYLPKDQINFDLEDIKESFAYLCVGHWMQGNIGEDRKNIGLLVKAFYEIFKNKTKTPALLLKVSGGGTSYMDRDMILEKIHEIKDSIKANNLPNVYLLHGEFTDSEMNELYNHPKVKALVSLTKGEGFGRPLLEFTQSKKPVIASNWSGHTDFLNPKFTTLINGDLNPVDDSAANDWIIKEAKWFAPNLAEVGHSLTSVFNDYKKFEENSRKQASYAKNRFSLDSMKEILLEIIESNSPQFVEEVELKLPEIEQL